jgi:hypothetical protein
MPSVIPAPPARYVREESDYEPNLEQQQQQYRPESLISLRETLDKVDVDLASSTRRLKENGSSLLQTALKNP